MMQALLLICLRDNGKEKGTLWLAALSQCRHRHYFVRQRRKQSLQEEKSAFSFTPRTLYVTVPLFRELFEFCILCYVLSLYFTLSLL